VILIVSSLGWMMNFFFNYRYVKDASTLYLYLFLFARKKTVFVCLRVPHRVDQNVQKLLTICWDSDCYFYVPKIFNHSAEPCSSCDVKTKLRMMSLRSTHWSVRPFDREPKAFPAVEARLTRSFCCSYTRKGSKLLALQWQNTSAKFKFKYSNLSI
jgi:hypothetical protein